ncbi:MAG TPA: hypothetical protein VG458_07620, partial [Solirubrobacterales bacterium]|nr:hypothetical protein [Solirubrobacterales bacterium]
MPAEQFVINIITTGDKEAVAAQGRVAASSKAMGDAAAGASAASARSATSAAQTWNKAGTAMGSAGKK